MNSSQRSLLSSPVPSGRVVHTSAGIVSKASRSSPRGLHLRQRGAYPGQQPGDDQGGEEEGPEGDEVQRVLDAPGVPWRDVEEVEAHGGDGQTIAEATKLPLRDSSTTAISSTIAVVATSSPRRSQSLRVSTVTAGAAEHRLGHRQPDARAFSGVMERQEPDGVR